MKPLFTFPFCSTSVNSISQGPVRLGAEGYETLVITSQHTKSLKGEVFAPYSEKIGATEFFRPFHDSQDIIRCEKHALSEVLEKVESFRPDVVVGFGDFCARLPIKLSRHFDLPLVMNLEYLRPNKLLPPVRGKRLLLKYFPVLYHFVANRYLRYLATCSAAIMFTYHGDQDRSCLLERWGTRAFYVPWCTEVGKDELNLKRNRRIGIHMGSLEPFKNASELLEAIPLILEKTETEHFVVVGPGTYAPGIKGLVQYYGSRIKYIESVPRPEALRLLRSAGYAYTPAEDSGAGFIGDCWGTGTPLITTHSIGGLVRPGVDTLRANGYEDLPRVINELLNSEELYESLKCGGLLRYETDCSAEAVAGRYKTVIREVLGEVVRLRPQARPDWLAK